MRHRISLEPIVDKITKNKLFLSTATNWNSVETRAPLLWFTDFINTYNTQYDLMFRQTAPMFENDEDETLRKFTKALIKEADINICDYRIQSREIVMQGDIPQDLEGGIKERFRPKQ